MKIDCQSHVFPKQYAEILVKNTGSVQTKRINSTYTIRYGDLQQFKLDPAAYDPVDTVRDMDTSGIDVSVISVNIPGPELLDAELALAGAQICNDYLAETCTRFPGRFVGLASLPLQDIGASISEFKRAVDQLGLRGIILFSNINGKPVDTPEMRPIFEFAEKRRVPVVLHPTVPSWGEVVKDYSMIPMFGLMVDTSIAMLRLILSGIMEEYPDLIIVHPHCGGVLPYLMPRVIEQTEVKGRGRDHITKSPMEYYRKVYFDLVSPSIEAMRYMYTFAGPDRLLFGSDRPWIKLNAFLDLIDRLDISQKDEDKILGQNAARIFRIN